MKGGILRDGSKVKDIRLGLLEREKPDQRNLSLHDLLRARGILGKKPVTRKWALDIAYDQGQKGICTATMDGHMLAAEPLLIQTVSTPSGVVPITLDWLEENIYFKAQLIDGFPGGASPGAGKFSEGTGMLATAKMTKRWDLIGAYYFAKTFEEMQLGLSYIGPAGIGIPWFKNFYEPDENGIIRMGGSKSGFHGIAGLAIDMENQWIEVQQSWGPTWGIEIDGRPGRFRIKLPVLEKLFYRRHSKVVFYVGRSP